MYIFIDESGDLGFDFSKNGKPTDFFLVGAIKIDDEKYLSRIIKRHRKRIKKKKKTKPEIKFTSTSPENRRRILEDISKTDLQIFIVYIDKHNAYEYIKNDPVRLYSYMLKILAEKCFPEQITENTMIVFDKTFSKTQQETLELYLKTQNEYLMQTKNSILILHVPSHERQGLLCADFVCGAVMQKINGKSDVYFNIIEDKLKCMKKVF